MARERVESALFSMVNFFLKLFISQSLVLQFTLMHKQANTKYLRYCKLGSFRSFIRPKDLHVVRTQQKRTFVQWREEKNKEKPKKRIKNFKLHLIFGDGTLLGCYVKRMNTKWSENTYFTHKKQKKHQRCFQFTT